MSKKAQLKIQVLKNRRFLAPSSLKAQLKIQEMAFMLVAVVLFFILVGLFALSLIYSNIHKQASEIEEARTLSSITNLANSPEFSCVRGKTNCVDSDKAIVLGNNKNYENFWPFTRLGIIKMSGFNKSEQELVKCDNFNYPNCDMIEIYDKQIKNEKIISSYVALCRKERENEQTYDKCEIARFIAGSEVK